MSPTPDPTLSFTQDNGFQSALGDVARGMHESLHGGAIREAGNQAAARHRRRRVQGRGLRSSTFPLNLSAFCGIGVRLGII